MWDSTVIEDLAAHRALRLACAGWVDEQAGSVASANHRLLAELVARGHEIDLYASAGALPDPGIGNSGFRLITIQLDEPSWLRAVDVRHGGLVTRLRGLRFVRKFRRALLTEIPRRHAERPYDALVFLGMSPVDALPERPLVAWPQATPGGELAPLRRAPRELAAIAGRMPVLALRVAYEIRNLTEWRWLPTAHVIVASEARAALLRSRRRPPKSVHVLPYAIDTDRFRPAQHRLPHSDSLVLALGRLDPRKRVDLLAAAVDHLPTDVRIEVVGRDGVLRGWRAMLEDVERRTGRLRVREAVSRDEALELIRTADVLIQTSEHEEFGHAVVEALACGVPVVVGPTNHTAEYVPHGAGTTFAAYTGADVADGITRAIALDRATAGAVGRASVVSRCSPVAVADGFEELLRAVS